MFNFTVTLTSICFNHCDPNATLTNYEVIRRAISITYGPNIYRGKDISLPSSREFGEFVQVNLIVHEYPRTFIGVGTQLSTVRKSEKWLRTTFETWCRSQLFYSSSKLLEGLLRIKSFTVYLLRNSTHFPKPGVIEFFKLCDGKRRRS